MQTTFNTNKTFFQVSVHVNEIQLWYKALGIFQILHFTSSEGSRRILLQASINSTFIYLFFNIYNEIFSDKIWHDQKLAVILISSLKKLTLISMIYVEIKWEKQRQKFKTGGLKYHTYMPFFSIVECFKALLQFFRIVKIKIWVQSFLVHFTAFKILYR